MQRITPFDAAIAELEGRLAVLRAQHPELDLLLTTLDGLRKVRDASMHGPQIAHDAFADMIIADAAKKYLSMFSFSKCTKSSKDIAEALEAGGFEHSALDFPQSISETLRLRPEFVRVNNNWALTEWFPVSTGERPKRRAGMERMILEAMQAEPERSWVPREMAIYIERNLNSVQSTMSSMGKAGKIQKLKKGYCLNKSKTGIVSAQKESAA